MYARTNRCYNERGSRTNQVRSSIRHCKVPASESGSFPFATLNFLSSLPCYKFQQETILIRGFLCEEECCIIKYQLLEASWNVMAHAQKPNFVFRRNGRVRLNRRGRQFSRLLSAEVCASAVVMLDTPRSEVVWRVQTTHSIRQFPLHFSSCASPCAITFQLDSTTRKTKLRHS